jgi:hypothetical protein
MCRKVGHLPNVAQPVSMLPHSSHDNLTGGVAVMSNTSVAYGLWSLSLIWPVPRKVACY